MRIVDTVRTLAVPVVEEMGLELVDVEYLKEGSGWILRLYIDKEGGVGLDDCEQVSRAVEPLLDGADPIDTAYTFEVSSPGLERPLRTERDFTRYRGEPVEVSLYTPVNGGKRQTGTLLGKENGVIRIEQEGTILELEEKNVSAVKRTVIW